VGSDGEYFGRQRCMRFGETLSLNVRGDRFEMSVLKMETDVPLER
jgi:hypothetical protein